MQHLISTLCLKPDDVMAIFSAYFDESDSPAASVVAGVVMAVEQVEPFRREWQELLDAEGVGYLHMREYAHFRGPFQEGWRDNPKRRANVLSRIVGIIARRCNLSIGIVIDRAGFQKAKALSPRVAQVYGNEYTAASIMAILRTLAWADKHGDVERIAYVFDKGNANRPSFDRAFWFLETIPELRRNYRVGLAFEDDIGFPALQAADFIAYELSKVFNDIAKDEQRLRASMAAVLQNVIGDWRVGDEAALLEWAAEA